MPGELPALVHKIICGQKLADLRERAGFTQKAVVKHFTTWSQSKVSHIEGGTSAIDPKELPPLFELYKVDAETRASLLRMAMQCKEQVGHGPRGKAVLRNRFDGVMRDVIDMEATAATVWRHNSMIVPGLLQTEDYMRNLFRAYRPSQSQVRIDQYVVNRLARQSVLDNPDQRFWFVIHEAALRSLEGVSSVMRAQARHLMEVIDRPNVEVQVAPFRNGFYPGQQESYVIFGFATDPAVQVTYVEKYDGGDILLGDRMTRFRTFWEHQRGHALGPEQTRPFLRELSRAA
jgi:hypothetical protein